MKSIRIKGLVFHALFLLSVLQALTQPVISSVSPSAAPIGTSITITGSGFNATVANNIVYFGAVKGLITAASANALTVTVPAGATYQPISVTVNKLTGFSPKPFNVTYSGASPVFTERSFAYSNFVDSLGPTIESTTYATGDINGDGKIDVAVIDRLNNSLSVYKNSSGAGNISFAPEAQFITGQSPRNLAIADLDGDGKLDIVVSNLSDNTISVFKNTSTTTTISFAAKTDFTTQVQPSGIAVADFDKDGRLDLVVNCISFPGYASVFRNTSTGSTISFATKFDISILGNSIEIIRTGDLDGDGFAEIMLPNYGLSTISIFRNTSTPGTISFALQSDIGTNGYPEQLEITDLNADGKPEMAVSYYLTSKIISIFTNASSPGNVSFNSSNELVAGNLTDGLTFNDLDGDGKPDMAVCTGLDVVSLFKNSSSVGGAISFDNSVNIPCMWFDPILTGDFDGDGKPDLTLLSGLFRVTIWKNRLTEPQITAISPDKGGLNIPFTISGYNLGAVNAVRIGGIPVQSFTVVNANTIVAYPANNASGIVSVSGPNGKDAYGQFEFFKKPILTSFNPITSGSDKPVTITGNNFIGTTAVSFGGVPATSFTIDSATSITAIVGNGASGFVKLTTPGGKDSLNGFTFIPAPTLANFTPASGTAGTTITITGTNFSNVSDISFGGAPVASFTVNSTTKITAIIGAGGSGNLTLTTIGGTATLPGFTYSFPVVPEINSFSPAIGNIGSSVTITGNNFNTVASKNIVYVGQARATVTAASATSLTITIPNGATYHPISVTNSATNLKAYSALPFVVSFPTGALNFKQHEDFQAGNISAAMTHLVNTDFDGDGKLDIITANNAESTISILRNTSINNILSFTKTDYVCPSGARNLVIADLDGDGRPDIVVASFASMMVFRNTSSSGAISLVALPSFELIGETGIAVADLDKDGRADIISADPFSNMVRILRNSSTIGKISFHPVVEFPNGGQQLAVTVADLDGDGWQDLVSTTTYNTVSVIRNTSQQGQLSFAAAKQFPTGSNPVAICAGDLDGDGKPDLAVANASENTVSIYHNTSTSGNISMAERISYDEGFVVVSQQQSIAMADLDGDGKIDICNSHFINPGPALVFNNNSSPGSLNVERLRNAFFLAGESATGIAIGDLNLDGRPDLVLGRFHGNQVAVLLHDFLPLPQITSFLPTEGKKGTIVTITGNNFKRIDSVFFGSVPASSFYTVSENEITAAVGGGATGTVGILSPAGSVSMSGFTYIPTPEIVSFSPASAAPGDTITIIGRDFVGVKSVSFLDTESPYFNTVSPDTLKVVVPEGSGPAYIIVRTETEQGSAIGFSFINSPVISSFTPKTAAKGETVTITGKNFTSATAVHFGGIPATSYNVVSNNSITAVLGGGATGYVRVTNASGVDSLAGFTFKVVTAVDNPTIDLSAELSIQPNPATDIITIKHPASVQKATILLVDANGRTVLIATTGKMSKQTTCHVNNLAAGLYQLIWIDGTRQAHKTLMIGR